MVSTMIRGVQLSHFHCAVAGIREGAVAWLFPSNALNDSKIYRRSGHLPEGAYQPWFEFNMGNGTQSQREGHAADWFSIYDERFEDQYVTEAYLDSATLVLRFSVSRSAETLYVMVLLGCRGRI